MVRGGWRGVDGGAGDWRLLSWASWAKLTLAVDEDDVLALRGTVGNILHIVVPRIQAIRVLLIGDDVRTLCGARHVRALAVDAECKDDL